MRKEEIYICVFVTVFLNCYMTRGDVEKIAIHMPGVRPKKNDSYICTSLKLPAGDSFIVKYEPDAHKETAHHMLLFGCKKPGRFGSKAWNCGDMGSGTCTGSESILFGWARDAPALQLPKDVGFRVGGNTEIQYLTLQIHYAHALEAKHYDRSGLTLHVKTAPQLNLASIYLLLASSAYIPPNSKGL
ncbi:peptidylglycine alpha-hydroxylating monooxygenase [Paramuricea clavata]|uniref:Peptidylglycine alpha-hydroxylating monooxygenase n=1 Tax=Paramuricea clavata TaxID=317549 RepID=A0A7D9H9E0_PARCT|nr:peptidylglycine alpha-hydroxylating monooxygenase [Paramuricea clavata]